jgi:hypothetical protein
MTMGQKARLATYTRAGESGLADSGFIQLGQD